MMLSALDRAAIVNKLASTHFDLLVVGGGVTGAGIALDAASRGLVVALVEKDDFAAGTSSKSTKLIHGGLRYLKQLELGLVREVGRERAIVHQMAPHLVAPEKMLLPLVKNGSLGPTATSLALWVYDVLAGVTGGDKRQMLDAQETLALEPLLRPDILEGGGYYAEYRTDDARLTIELIKTAVKYGAVVLNYADVEGFTYRDGYIHGARVNNRVDGSNLQVTATQVVNAAGPWVDELRREDGSLNQRRLFLSKGVHIVVARQRLPLQQAAYFDTPDGRMIFAIPRGRATYIGTTDTPYSGDPDGPTTNLADVAYLLEATNRMFPGVHLEVADVESSWAGLRPLIYEEGKSASELSRKDEIFESASGLISIAGGKLTGFRKMAERVVDLVATKHRDIPPSCTKTISLAGGPFADYQAVLHYTEELAAAAVQQGLPTETAAYLVGNYGRQAETILLRAADAGGYAPQLALARAEAWFAIHHEMALEPLDFLARRSGRLYFDLPGIAPVLAAVLAVFQDSLGWTDSRREQAQQEVEKAIFEASHFV